MRLAEYLSRVLGWTGRDSTTKLRHFTTQSLNHKILKFAGTLMMIDCAGLSYMDFACRKRKTSSSTTLNPKYFPEFLKCANDKVLLTRCTSTTHHAKMDLNKKLTTGRKTLQTSK